MAQPPRLKELLLDPNERVVYFVTLCVNQRRPILANHETFSAIRRTLEQMRRWRSLGGVVMPDHVHIIITPAEERSLPVSDFATGFKRLLRKTLPHEWDWQQGCFDRLLRSGDNLQDKWTYIRDNPVRAGLVTDIDKWSYYLGSTAQQKFVEGTVGEAVSLPNNIGGNLAGSPTVESASLPNTKDGNLTGPPTAGSANESGKLTASPTERQSNETGVWIGN